MTTKPDSGGEGTQEQAGSEGSNSQPNQKGSSGEAQYVTLEQFNKLNQGLESMRRSMQSEKDKGIKQVRAEVGELREILQGYAGKNVSDVLDALNEQEERDARQATLELAKLIREGKLSSGGSGGTEQSKGVDVGAVLKELELDEGDTRVQEFRSRSFASETEALREAAKLQKKILTVQPSAADEPSTEGKRHAPASNQEKLREEYNTRAAKLYGTPLLRLKREMREKGLEIS